MPFWVGYYHLVWTTKYRQPIITSVYEPIIYYAIHRKSAQLKCRLIAINGIPDHIHLAISIPPSVTVAHVVSQLKGVSSYEMNQTFPDREAFHWQGSYGGLTFGEKVLPLVVEYIQNQKVHHQENTVISYLENVGE